METDADFTLEISFDGVRWREMPRGYRQDGIILANEDGVVTQSIGRGDVVRYRAVPAERLVPVTARG